MASQKSSSATRSSLAWSSPWTLVVPARPRRPARGAVATWWAIVRAARAAEDSSSPTDLPFDVTFDDRALVERILDVARSGRTDELAKLHLPARVDRVRASVRALHDLLVGTVRNPPDLPRLFAALDAVALAHGGAAQNPPTLGPL